MEKIKYMNRIVEDKGFTLPELMVASFILSVTFLAILLSFIKCMELSELSRNSSSAVAEIKSKMEQIKNTAFGQIITNYNNVSFDPAVSNIAVGKGKGVSYVSNVNANLLQVTVTFCWRQKNGRVIGEDTNLNGAINTGEDINGNGTLDSPTQLISYIYDR